jgi:hypothetical protein
VLGRRLIRLQCYEGIDASAALYEWNYPRQMLAIRQAGEESIDIYGETFLIERPMLASLRAPDSTVLLIDEIDRADQEFEAFLLEFLSDFQISIPERGTVRADGTPRRRADLEPHPRPARGAAPPLRLSLDRLSHRRREARIVMMRASSVAESTAARRRRRGRESCGASRSARRLELPRRWTGPKRPRCCTSAARAGRMPSSARSAWR